MSQVEKEVEAIPQYEVQKLVESKVPEIPRLISTKKTLSWHCNYIMESNIIYCLLTKNGEPSTLQEVLNNLEVSQLIAAMEEEIEVLHENKTWELLSLPLDRKPISNKWVYKIKHNSDNQVDRYRTRLVVEGYAQKEGIDFNKLFSPMV